MYTHIILYVHENNTNYYYYFISIVYYTVLCLVCSVAPTQTQTAVSTCYLYYAWTGLQAFCWLLVGISSFDKIIAFQRKNHPSDACYTILMVIILFYYVRPKTHKLKLLLHRYYILYVPTSSVYRLYRTLILTSGFFIYDDPVYFIFLAPMGRCTANFIFS